MTRFLVGLLTGFLLAGSAANATIVDPAPAAGVPFHPTGTVQPFLPLGCDVTHEIHSEQHRERRLGLRPEVRELVVYRLDCGRTMVARGPWMPAFVD